MLVKTVVISKIEVTEFNVVQVCTSTRISESGSQISESKHRHCIAPGQSYNQEDPKVQALCAALHTDDVIAAYAAMAMVVPTL